MDGYTMNGWTSRKREDRKKWTKHTFYRIRNAGVEKDKEKAEQNRKGARIGSRQKKTS